MIDDLVKRLRSKEVTLRDAKKAADQIDSLHASLKSLVECAEMVRETSSFDTDRRQQRVTANMWSALCLQIKFSRAVLTGGGEK